MIITYRISAVSWQLLHASSQYAVNHGEQPAMPASHIATQSQQAANGVFTL